jgi:hypothetical protein
MSNLRYTLKTSCPRGILFAFSVALSDINPPVVKHDNMKNADKPFIGIIIVTIALLYSVIAMLS